MMALGCLCTPEYMPSICLLYGFEMALGGLPPFLVQGSRFDVRRSTFSLRPEPQMQQSRLPARRRLEAPPVGSKLSTASVRRDSHESPRHPAPVRLMQLGLLSATCRQAGLPP